MSIFLASIGALADYGAGGIGDRSRDGATITLGEHSRSQCKYTIRKRTGAQLLLGRKDSQTRDDALGRMYYLFTDEAVHIDIELVTDILMDFPCGAERREFS